jgi:AcrR family transcriptional regulator
VDRHSQASEDIRRSVIDAFAKLAVERGYAGTTVGAVAAAAGVSRGAFYRHFDSKRQCLIAAFDAYFDRLVDEVGEAMEAGLGFLAETAGFARLFAVEALAAGPAVLVRRFAGMERLVLLLRAGRDLYPEAGEAAVLTEPVLVAGIASVVTAALLFEEDGGLPALEVPLVEILLTPYLGPAEARQVAVLAPLTA